MRVLRAQLEAIVRREARIAVGEGDTLVRRKVDGFFWPMYRWIEEVVARTKRSRDFKPCVCVGLSCVQGGGKTTTSNILRQVLQLSGYRCAVVSLDDVYLTRKQQVAVAEANPTNPLLHHRGNPGTHDLPLLMKLIQQCQRSGETVALPRFNKSLHNGRGDRIPDDEWESLDGPLDILLIEGWCLGFQAKPPSEIADPNLIPVNEALRGFDELYESLDALVVVKVQTPQWVYRWREEPESHLRETGKPALTADQVRDFVDRFMPAYSAYLPGLYAPPQPAPRDGNMASHLEVIPRLEIEIDVTRTPSLSSPPVEYNIHSETLAARSDDDLV